MEAKDSETKYSAVKLPVKCVREAGAEAKAVYNDIEVSYILQGMLETEAPSS